MIIVLFFREESLNRCIHVLTGEVKQYKAAYEGGDPEALNYLRAKQGPVIFLKYFI